LQRYAGRETFAISNASGIESGSSGISAGTPYFTIIDLFLSKKSLC